jgi:anti-anti-sigma factor
MVATPAGFSFDEATGTLVVTGDLDGHAGQVLAERLDQHLPPTTGGRLDLSGVQFLPSHAVSVIARAWVATSAHDRVLELVAAPGTIARSVLDVVALPAVTA